jgi:hypothetical protein
MWPVLVDTQSNQHLLKFAMQASHVFIIESTEDI